MAVDVAPGSLLRRRLAHRISAPQEGIRTRMLEIAAGMVDVIALGRGDPDLPTPAHILEAAKAALDNGATHYTHPAGDLALREAIARQIAATTGVDYDPATEIIVTTGAQEAIALAMLTLINPGDEVILPTHRFSSYDMAVELAGGSVVAYQSVADGQFRLSASEIERVITKRSRLLTVVSPDNPTGGVAAAADLAAIADLSNRHDLAVISDEIYSHFVYDDNVHTSILSMPDMRDRTLLVNGVSKCYAMTGFRVGYLAGPADYMRSIVEAKHTLSICTPAVAQAAALAALNGPQECIGEMRAIYDDRRRCMMAALTGMNLPFVYPAGAFYVYVDVSSTGMASPDFCLRLLLDTGVMIFPGTMFGSDGERWIRMSLLAPRERIVEAAGRLTDTIRAYQRS